MGKKMKNQTKTNKQKKTWHDFLLYIKAEKDKDLSNHPNRYLVPFCFTSYKSFSLFLNTISCSYIIDVFQILFRIGSVSLNVKLKSFFL